MVKQPATRNQRYKGFRVKHVLQICALLAICIWLLNQVKNSYDNMGSGFFQMETSEHSHVVVKRGRKYLHPQGKGSSAETNGGLVEEVDEEMEESAAEENEDDERGGGDDEIDGRDQEKAEREESEEIEDLIDEEDREKENQIEDLSLLEDQSINEGDEQHKIDEDDEQRGVTEKLVGIPS